MALPQGASRPALRLVPDTGAEALVLFRAPGRDPSPGGSPGRDPESRSHAG
jgi:hypothetical protein